MKHMILLLKTRDLCQCKT